MSYIKPKIYHGWSPAKKQVWNWLEERELKEGDEGFELNQSKLAERLGYHRKTIQNALKTFIRGNLLQKVQHGEGRGNHCWYAFLWVFNKLRPKRKRTKKKTTKNITKGSPLHRYWMYKFRTWVEDTHFEGQASILCGELFQIICGEPVLTAKKLYHRLQERMMVDWTLSDFYFWLDEFKGAVLDHSNADHSRDESSRSGTALKLQKDEMFQEDPPPRIKDYDTVGEWKEAVEEWEQGCDGDDGSGDGAG